MLFAMVEIREERAGDHVGVHEVHLRAFAPSTQEAQLVDALRAADDRVPELCLVAVDGPTVVGAISLSRATLEPGGAAVLALAPLGVAPERQGEGIGSALVDEGLLRAAQTAMALVVVLGAPGFYRRFGFASAAEIGVDAPFPVDPEAWMARRLTFHTAAVRGTVRYPPAFDALD